MSSMEFAEWLAFASVEPIGEARKDLRTAQICAVLVNINRGKGKPVQAADFMPQYWKEDDGATDEEMLAQAGRITEMLEMTEGA